MATSPRKSVRVETPEETSGRTRHVLPWEQEGAKPFSGGRPGSIDLPKERDVYFEPPPIHRPGGMRSATRPEFDELSPRYKRTGESLKLPPDYEIPEFPEDPPLTEHMNPNVTPLPPIRRAPRKVKPPPESDGFFATMKREYGWKAWLFPVIPLVLGYFIIVPSLKIRAAVEDQNGDAIIDIIGDLNRITRVSDTDTASFLDHVEFSKAAAPVSDIHQYFQNDENHPIHFMVDNFVSRSREVDRSFRSFMAQRLETIAEVTGRLQAFEDYIANVVKHPGQKGGYGTFAMQDFSDIPDRLLMEGQFLLCQLGHKKGANCPLGATLSEIYDDLEKELKSSLPALPKSKLFNDYHAMRAKATKIIRETRQNWDKTIKNIETSQRKYDLDSPAGKIPTIRQELEKLGTKLRDGVQSQRSKHVDMILKFPNNIVILARRCAGFPKGASST